MKRIFPISIVQHTTEYYQSKIAVRSKAIYLAVIFLMLSVLVSLPLIKVDVAVQARGTFQTSLSRNEVTSLVGGRIDNVYLRENLSVRKGDVLATIRTEAVDFEIKSALERKMQIQGFIKDLKKLIALSDTTFNFGTHNFGTHDLLTSIYRTRFLKYQGNLSQYHVAL